MIGEEWICRKYGAATSAFSGLRRRIALHLPGRAVHQLWNARGRRMLKKQRWLDEISFRKRRSPTDDGATRFTKTF
ncbi:hypothetical protein [Burkholderia sp. BCC0044]|uniref:hypothetical protein n=1 Tax=Burkholderia sp. BCC0044 TaxID=2676295 RepID=UPI00158C821D|nr:hypothetical protein [Burkholderia sp. BCC0044]